MKQPIYGSVEDGTFKALTEDQMKDMEPEELAKYFNEQNKHREKELTDKLEVMKTDASDEIKAEVKKLKDEIVAGNVEQMKVMMEAQEAQGLALRKLMDEGSTENPKSLEAILKGKQEDFKDIPTGKIIKFEVNKTDVTRASITDSTLGQVVPGVGQIATRRTIIRSLFKSAAVGKNSNGVVRFTDQLAVTRSADWKLESYQKPESAITWIEKSIEIEKIADTIPVTMEALEDVDFIAGEIRNLLLTNLELKIDEDLFDGSGATPVIEGVYTYADTYVPVAAGIANATIYDLLVKVHEDITGATKYMPNYAIMNITDINKMRLSKDVNGNYILPPFASANGDQVAGITIIASGAVAADTMLVGDFDYAVLHTLGGLKIDIGLIDKQFVENMVTLRAEERMGLLVRSVHEDAFRKVTAVDAAVTTIGS
jgi:HK97 family phage major capsid protein